MSQSDLEEIEKAIREARQVSARIRSALATLETTIDNALEQISKQKDGPSA